MSRKFYFNTYRFSTFIAAIIICLIVIYLHLMSHNKTQAIYLEQTEQTILNLKKDYLKDTVNNIFLEIDSLREVKYNNYEKNIYARLSRLNEELEESDEAFITYFVNRFREDTNKDMWTALLWDDATKEIYYDSTGIKLSNFDNKIESMKQVLSSFVTIEKGNIKGLFGVSKSYIDEIVKYEISNLIRNRTFSNDTYIWVNEVVNYEGGDDYAIRRVHPNLENTEGMYLSTNMEDVKGNLPYLEELEGIKKDGELFFTYYFKKLNSSQISEKITYAKLYKEFDWVIAMGVHLDDIDAYAAIVNNNIDSLASEAIIRILTYILIVLLIGFIILYLIDKKHLLSSTKSLQKEINYDSLTKARSRRFGEISLSNYHKSYGLTSEKVAVMMLDVDNFKQINDSYGHKAGDIVLAEIVNTLKGLIREADQIIRWGGDEFVGIFPGLKEENITQFGMTLLEQTTALNIRFEKEIIHVSVSVGFSYIKETDNDYNDVLKRADIALYKSKEQGKNKVNVVY